MAASKWLLLFLSSFSLAIGFSPMPISLNAREHVKWMSKNDPSRLYVEAPGDFLDGKLEEDITRRKHRRVADDDPVISSKAMLDGPFHTRGIIHYGATSDVVFVLTFELQVDGIGCIGVPSSSLYRSTNDGSTFRKETFFGSISLWPDIYINPADNKELILIHSSDYVVYITVNEGNTYNRYQVDIDPKTIKFHESVVNLSLAFRPEEKGDCNAKRGDLYVSIDGSRTWVARREGIGDQYYWETPQYELSQTLQTKSNATFYYKGIDGRLYRDSVIPGLAGAAEFDSNLGIIDYFVINKQFIFAEKTNADDSKSLFVSAHRNPFQKAKIPIPEGHKSYDIDIVRDHQAMVIVAHGSDTGEDYYNVYLSDDTGSSYSLSLENLVLEKANDISFYDLEEIEGIPGTFIANQRISSHTGTTDNLRSLISFDGGAEWELIRPPANTFDENGVLCEPPLCSLHFHMSTSNYFRLGVASWDTVPGIILAHGTAGSKLAKEPDLFISRDGGINWDKTLSDSWGVNLMDFGGIILAAKDYHHNRSSEIKYTCTEGLAWRAHDFGGQDVTVWGVITEPGETSVTSLLFGTAPGSKWIVIKLNFTNAFEKKCGKDDYYIWEPWNERIENSACLFGETLKIDRRKINRCCFNGGDFDRNIITQTCPCTENDYECDWGYRRENEMGGSCVRDSDVALAEPSCENGNIYAPSGYRKIAGDHCEGGDTDELDPINYKCSSSDSSSKVLALGVVFAVLVLLLITIVIILAVVVVFSLRRYARMRSNYSRMHQGAQYQQVNPAEDEEPHVHFSNDDEDILQP